MRDKKNIKNFSMILSLNDEKLLDQVKELTGEATRKHSILAMAREYVKAHEDAEKLKKEVMTRQEKTCSCV